MKSNIVVFTDLDGSLLDHKTYEYEAAQPALARLREAGIAVIPVTSKTLEEISLLDFSFGKICQVAENGMVIKHASGLEVQGRPYGEIIKFIDDLPANLRSNIRGFNDMSNEDVIECTGLSLPHAVAAKHRDATEPFIWLGSDREMDELATIADRHDLTITRGGRFYHLMGKGDKSAALQWVLENVFTDENPVTVALGDGPNDVQMLGFADYGVVIPNPEGSPVNVGNAKGKIITAPHSGPVGWNVAIHTILDELGVSG